MIKLIDVVNNGFILIQISLAIAAVLMEINFVGNDHDSLREIKTAISVLSNYLERHNHSPEDVGYITRQETGEHSLRWMIKHLAGVANNDSFEPKIEANNFVLYQYPNALNNLPRSPMTFAPTLLTALGVLGTFAGIFLGLQEIEISAISDPQQLLKSSTQLLEGMKLAFLTSLLGLGSSSVFMLLLAWGEKQRKQNREKLRNKLNQIAFLENPQRLFSRFSSDSNQEAAGALIKAAQTMKTGFSEIVASQTRINPEIIGQQVGMVLLPVFQEIRQELSLLREIKADQGQELLTNVITELRAGAIDPILLRLDETAQLTQQASEAVRELKNELGGISSSLASSILTIQNFQQDTLGKLQEFAGSLQQILSQFQTETHGVLQEMAGEIQAGVNESLEGMKAQRSAFKENAEEAAATFRGIREDLQSALQTQSELEQERLQNVQERMVNILKAAHSAFQNQSTTIQTVGQEASKLMLDARENLIFSLQNVDGMIQNTRLTVQQELENFRLSYQDSLTQFFNEQNNLLESTLGQQRTGLAEVVTDLQNVFQEEAQKRRLLAEQINQSMAEIQKTTENVCNMANQLGLTSSERLEQLQKLTHTIGDEAKQVENAYNNLVTELQQALQSNQQQTRQIESVYQNFVDQFNQALELGNQQLINYLHETNNSQTQFFEQADQSMAQVCEGLQETSAGLMQVAQYLVAAADNIGTKNAK